MAGRGDSDPAATAARQNRKRRSRHGRSAGARADRRPTQPNGPTGRDSGSDSERPTGKRLQSHDRVRISRGVRDPAALAPGSEERQSANGKVQY